MTDPATVARAYLAAWNEPDDANRLALMSDWTDHARYVDPIMQGEGRAGIAGMIAAARTQFPGHGFTLRGVPDGHGDHVRFSWTLAPHGGAPVAQGTDMVRLDSDGRIDVVIGFLDGGAA